MAEKPPTVIKAAAFQMRYDPLFDAVSMTFTDAAGAAAEIWISGPDAARVAADFGRLLQARSARGIDPSSRPS